MMTNIIKTEWFLKGMSSLSSVRSAGGADFSDLIRYVPQTIANYSKLMQKDFCNMSKTKNVWVFAAQ